MKVSVCNFRSSDFKEKFVDSLVHTGFAVITHHGVDHILIKETQAAWKEFFNQKRGYKDQFTNPNDPNMGYTGFGGEKAVSASKPDLKEFFHWRPNQIIPKEVQFLTEKIYHLLEGHISGQLLQMIDSLNNTNYLKACQNSNNTVLRALYYPALNEIKVEEGSVRGSAHEDINFITLLVAATAPGLQVLDSQGNWHEVPHEENSIVVNIGDMLQLASGKFFKSTKHRVINPSTDNIDRISLPLFIHPHGDTLLAPGVTAQQYLNERLTAIYQKEYKK